MALYITQMGCPTYFQTPRETGGAWAWRMVVAQFFNVQLKGDGRCERIFALSIAQALKIKGAQSQAIAAHKIHQLLQKDQLVAYAMATVTFERSIIGVEDGARRLFKSRVESLKLEELAELDFNPVIVSPDGVEVVDSRVRIVPAPPAPDEHLRRLG